MCVSVLYDVVYTLWLHMTDHLKRQISYILHWYHNRYFCIGCSHFTYYNFNFCVKRIVYNMVNFWNIFRNIHFVYIFMAFFSIFRKPSFFHHVPLLQKYKMFGQIISINVVKHCTFFLHHVFFFVNNGL